MRKFLSLLFILIFVLSISACSVDSIKSEALQLSTTVANYLSSMLAPEDKYGNIEEVDGNVENNDMLGLPVELYTPIFAIARIVGWSAHRLEELINMDKIIRPAYVSISNRADYVPMKERI